MYFRVEEGKERQEEEEKKRISPWKLHSLNCVSCMVWSILNLNKCFIFFLPQQERNFLNQNSQPTAYNVTYKFLIFIVPDHSVLSLGGPK